jgi:hypothetical protein
VGWFATRTLGIIWFFQVASPSPHPGVLDISYLHPLDSYSAVLYLSRLSSVATRKGICHYHQREHDHAAVSNPLPLFLLFVSACPLVPVCPCALVLLCSCALVLLCPCRGSTRPVATYGSKHLPRSTTAQPHSCPPPHLVLMCLTLVTTP